MAPDVPTVFERAGACGRRAAFVVCVSILAACARGDAPLSQQDGVQQNEECPHLSAERGRRVLEHYECGVCHVIPGIRGAVGKVGPALDHYAQRPYLAGKFPNEPETLVRWILDAPAMAPQTAMPAIAMSQQDACDAAAFLYTAD